MPRIGKLHAPPKMVDMMSLLWASHGIGPCHATVPTNWGVGRDSYSVFLCNIHEHKVETHEAFALPLHLPAGSMSLPLVVWTTSALSCISLAREDSHTTWLGLNRLIAWGIITNLRNNLESDFGSSLKQWNKPKVNWGRPKVDYKEIPEGNPASRNQWLLII